MQKKGKLLIAATVVAVVAGAVSYVTVERSDLALLSPHRDLRIATIKQALREPVIRGTYPILGEVEWPKKERDFAAIQNMKRRDPNIAGVLFVAGNMLDMISRLEIDGVEYPIVSGSSFNAHIVPLPKVNGNEPKSAILHRIV